MTLITKERQHAGQIVTNFSNLPKSKAPEVLFKAKFLKGFHKGKYSAKYENIVVQKYPSQVLFFKSFLMQPSKIMIWDITQKAHIFWAEYLEIPKFRDICEISLFLIYAVSLLKWEPRA